MNRRSPDLTLESRTSRGPDRYHFETVDGVRSKDSFRTPELLLLEALWDRDVDRLLCPEANYGVVGVVATDAADEVTMTESSARALNCCRRNARINGASASVKLVADLTTLGREFDAVAYAPREYAPIAVGKRRAVDALSVLEPGGRLFLAASPECGLDRYRSCLEDAGADVEALVDRDGCAVVVATRPNRFDPPTYVSPRTLEPTVDGASLSLVSVPGLFAASELDRGTRLLAESVAVSDGERVLDLCCGYGALGAYAAKTVDCDVWLTDDDRVATRCAECSLESSGVDGQVVTADCLAGVADRRFDAILCNPPTHAGSGVLDDLFAGAHDVLAPDGTLHVVHHRSLDLSRHFEAFAALDAVYGPDHVVRRFAR